MHIWTSPENQKEKDHTCKHVLLPVHVQRSANTWQWSVAREKRKMLSRLPGYAGFHKTLEDKQKGDARHSGTLFNTSIDLKKWWSQAQRHVVQHIDRQVKKWKKANCPTLLRRITRLKCVNSEIKSNVGSTTWKGIPRRAHVILSNRHEWHTCSEQLFELLTWNVSIMQKAPTKKTRWNI